MAKRGRHAVAGSVVRHAPLSAGSGQALRKTSGAAHHERLRHGLRPEEAGWKPRPCCVSVVVFLGSSMQRAGG